MSDLLPQTHITGFALVDGGSDVPGTGSDKYLLIPRTSIPQLDVADCDEEDGDIRKVVFALCEMIYQVYAAMATADRPTKWASYRSPGTPDDDGIRTPTYTNQFTVADSATEVVSE